jgi:hypothetical protein
MIYESISYTSKYLHIPQQTWKVSYFFFLIYKHELHKSPRYYASESTPSVTDRNSQPISHDQAGVGKNDQPSYFIPYGQAVVLFCLMSTSAIFPSGH